MLRYTWGQPSCKLILLKGFCKQTGGQSLHYHKCYSCPTRHCRNFSCYPSNRIFFPLTKSLQLQMPMSMASRDKGANSIHFYPRNCLAVIFSKLLIIAAGGKSISSLQGIIQASKKEITSFGNCTYWQEQSNYFKYTLSQC